VSVGVQADLREHRWISQGPEDLSEEDRAEIDDLLGSVVEPDSQAVRSEQLEGPDSIQWVFHAQRGRSTAGGAPSSSWLLSDPSRADRSPRRPAGPGYPHALEELRLFRHGVESFRRHIGSIGPDDGPGNWIEQDLAEDVGIEKRLKDRTLEKGKEVHAPLNPIAEGQPKGMGSGDLHRYDVWNHWRILHR
jgi:hypothetical protein